MNKKRLRSRLQKYNKSNISDYINEVLPLTNENGCLVYKKRSAWDEIDFLDEIIYIPNVNGKNIAMFWKDVSSLSASEYKRMVEALLNTCYMKSDFGEIAGERANELFDQIEFQVPEDLWDEIVSNENEGERQNEDE